MRISLRRIVFVLTVIAVIGTLVFSGLYYFLPIYLSHKFDIEVNRGSSVGIIGGADGPTAVFVSSGSSSHLIPIAFAFLSIAGIAYLVFTKKTTK